MPKINSITIALAGDKQVYRPGEVVKGHWTIDVGDAFSVKGVRLALKGAAYTRWSNDNPRSDDNIGYESFTSTWRTVFGTKLDEKSSGSHIYPVKKHVHEFSFRLPADRLPSSYEGNYGAIRYWLYLEIDRPLFRFNITRIKTITVLDNINVNDAQFTKCVARKTEKKVHTALVVGNEGNVMLHAQTDRGAYCPGEKMAISLIANNGTDRDLGVVKATLTQEVLFHANGERKIKNIPLQSVTGGALKKQEKRNWTRQALTVPAVPPTTGERTCQIVTVSYYVKVLVDIPILHGGDVYVILPVTIGTIPQGHSSRPGGASNSFEIDASTTITHAPCTRGFDQFSKGDGRFITTSYVPWCTYVPNFKFQTPPVKAAAKPVTARQPAKPVPQTAAPATRAPPRLAPSAPSIDIAPPSYEDVMNEIANSKTKSEQTTTSTSEPDTESAKAPPDVIQMPQTASNGFLILRFPDKHLQAFRTALVDSADLLKKHSGQVLALSAQVIVSSGSWPSRTAVALFVFPTKDDGKQWVSQSEDIFKSNDVEFQTIVLTNTNEQFQNEKNIFVLSNLEFKAGYSAARAKLYATKARQLLKPLRVEKGGIVVCVTKVVEHVTGSWPNPGQYVTLSQWDSMDQIMQYKAEKDGDKYKEVIELYKEIFEKTMAVMFQTEDLSFIQDITDNAPDSEDYQLMSEEKKEE